jgi:3-isopropylmalate dehydratase small subunit
MERDIFINQIEGKTILKVVISESTNTSEFKILKLITTDGFEIDLNNLTIIHPAYENEKIDFLEKINTALPDSFFDIDITHMTYDEIRLIVNEHAKSINANGGNVNSGGYGKLRVRFGENLENIR